MHKHFSHRRRLKVSSLLLALLLFRAYVPVGFMPASGTPFLLELCPAAAAMPMSGTMAMSGDMASMHHDMASMPMAPHHEHSGIHGHFDHCPFGSVPATGPISSSVVFEPTGRLVSRYRANGDPAIVAARPTRAHPARGPPSLV